MSYGFVARPGIYETTLTRPNLFGTYYLEQFRLLVENHHVSLEVGTSKQPMPVHFSVPEDEYIEATMVAEPDALVDVWIADVSGDPSFLRASIAAKAGLHGAFASPSACRLGS